MKKIYYILLLIVFIIPSTALASWWNPFSWKVFSFLNKSGVTKEVQVDKNKDTTNLNNVFYLKSAKDVYKLGELVTVSIFSKGNISYRNAQNILGTEVRISLIRPDGSKVVTTSPFYQAPFVLDCPDCFDPYESDFENNKIGVSYIYEDSSPGNLSAHTVGSINQVGNYKATAFIAGFTTETNFLVEESEIDTAFLEKIGNYSLVTKNTGKSIVVDKVKEFYEANYSYKNQTLGWRNPQIKILIALSSVKSDFKLLTGTLSTKEFGQNIYFYPPNQDGYFKYSWISGGKMITISGRNIAKISYEEKKLLEIYLKKYPSSL